MASFSFDAIEKAFLLMTDEDKEIITSVHPLLDSISFSDGAKQMGMVKKEFNKCLDRIFERFPLLKKEVLAKDRIRRSSVEEDWPDCDIVMEEFAGTFGMEPAEYEFLKLIHPIFNINMTRNQACVALGWCRPTGLKIWNDLLKRYPALIDSIHQWTTPEEMREPLENPMKVANFDDPYFGRDKIVRTF